MKLLKHSALTLACLCACSAHAESNVTIYGLLDTALVASGGGPKGSTVKLESGVSNGSRLGFKGNEDLGGGLSAIFTLESGILADTGASDQSGTLFGRQAFVGLSSRTAGTLTMGRQYTLMFETLTEVDPFANNYGGASGQLMSGEKAGTRQNNTVEYASPTYAGFSGQAAYGFGEQPGNAAKSRQFEYSARYENGPLLLRGTYNRTDNATATAHVSNTLLMARYRFNVATVSYGIGDNRGPGAVASRDMIAAVSVPFGPHNVAATLVHKSDRAHTGLGANQVAGAYTYALSQRTNLFLAYAKLSNTRFATTKFGDGDRELDIGIKHKF